MVLPFTRRGWGGWLDMVGGGPLTTAPLVAATISGKYEYFDDKSMTEELFKSSE